MTVVRIQVKFGHGMPEDAAGWAIPGKAGVLDLAKNRVRIATELTISNPFPPERTYNLAALRFLAYENAGTKTNVSAVAAFGVLGLGARKAWTLITLGLPDRDAQFLVRAPLHEVRSLLQQATASSPSLGSLIVEGSPPSVQPNPAQRDGESSPSPLSELERIAKLYQDGLLTEDEFSSMKAKLLDEE